MQNFRSSGRGLAPLPRLALAGALMLPLAACSIDELLDLPDPDIVDPTVFTDSTALPAYRAAAYRNFAWATGNAQDAQIQYSGMFADELVNVETFDTRVEIDRRDIRESNSNVQAATRLLYRSRTMAYDAADAYRRWSPNNVGLSEVYSLASYTYSQFGQNYCSGVPFSRLLPDGSFEYGGPETTQQIHTRALAMADSALAAARRAPTTPAAAETNRNIALNMARLARGRALLNLNRVAEAAVAVDSVPTGFVFAITHSENTAAENNGVFMFNTINRRISPVANEAGEGLPYYADNDPRLPILRTAGGAPAQRQGFATGVLMRDQLKYENRSAPTPYATGVEARLIEAEAQLRSGVGNWLATLNALRAAPPATIFPATRYPGIGSLAPLTDPGTEAGRVDLLFKERAYWMWLTGQRLGDMRRLVRYYGRAVDKVYPSGDYFRQVQGGEYGNQVAFPITVDERNNPEFANFPAGNLCLHQDN